MPNVAICIINWEAVSSNIRRHFFVAETTIAEVDSLQSMLNQNNKRHSILTKQCKDLHPNRRFVNGFKEQVRGQTKPSLTIAKVDDSQPLGSIVWDFILDKTAHCRAMPPGTAETRDGCCCMHCIDDVLMCSRSWRALNNAITQH